MARELDTIVVVDVEATCWEGTQPPDQQREIIEIGVCLLDVASGQRGRREGILVRPERSTISAFCTALTTLTPEEVATGRSFVEACAYLADTYGTRNRLWASWGDYDRQQFEAQVAQAGNTSPFGTGHLNVKTLFAVTHGLSRELGMDAALEHLGEPLEGTHHRGVDDAWNIAGILGQLLLAGRAARPGRSGADPG